jgi:tripartite-type tricarboxylate transporter receptor subunit TctC
MRQSRNKQGKGMPSFLTFALTLFFCLYCATGAMAAFQPFMPYPSANSTILNPFDSTDDSSRLLFTLQPYYSAATGRNFSVQDMPGRGGATAWIDIATRKDDAYTLTLTDLPNLAMLSLIKYPPYSLRDIRNVCILASMPLMLWVPKKSNFKDIYSLINSARTKPNQIVIAGLGRGTIQHLATLRFNRMSGVKFGFSPHTGVESAMSAVLGGKKHAFWGYPSVALAKTNDCRPLAIASEQRHALFPDVPTFLELGYGLLESSYFGLAVSTQTNTRASAAIGTVFFGLANNKDFQKEISAAGFIPTPVGAFDLNNYLHNLLEYYTRQKEEYDME